MADEEFMFGDLFATVRVQDLPASREVVAVERQESGTWRVCGSAIANTDGIAELGIEGSKTSRVYAFAIDHWGEPFTPNKTVAYGDIIRPSVFLGWLYRVTAPGVLPGEEPVWWNSTPGMPRPVGSAMAQAEMYFQPIAHGPVDIEWVDPSMPDPYWANVVSLLHFDGDATDQRGIIWGEKTTPYYAAGGVSMSRALAGCIGTGYVSDLDVTGLDFTIEFYVKANDWSSWSKLNGSRHLPNAFGKMNGFGSDVNYWSFGPTQSGKLAFYAYNKGESVYLITAGTVPTGKLTHVSLVRSGNNMYASIGGVVEFIGVVGTIDQGPPSFFTIGEYYGSRRVGLQDELRVTKEVARYTESFTPPTEPFPNFGPSGSSA